MNEMALYKLLQDHVGVLNKLVVDLYNGAITKEDAEAQAKAKITETQAVLEKK
jgi:hypothetical protein